MPAPRHAATRLGATLLHYDGGAETSLRPLAGSVSRADLVVFPVDCVSRDAALAVKRLCRQTGRPFQLLRSSGVSSFLAALAEYGEARPVRPAGMAHDSRQ